MKKTVFFGLLVIVLAFYFIGCGDDSNGTTTYTVTFESNGGSNVQKITGITSGSKILKPTDPTKGTDAFDGWFKEIGLTNEWNFSSDIVTSDVTLYAKWIPNGNSGDSGLNDIGSNGSLVNIIDISNIQVYEDSDGTPVNIAQVNFSHYWTFNGASGLSDITDANVKVTDSKLALKLGTPSNGTSVINTISEFNGATISDVSANILTAFQFSDGPNGWDKFITLMKESQTGYSMAFFIYTDRPVTVFKSSNPQLDLNLSTGWNIAIAYFSSWANNDADSLKSSNNLADFKWIGYF